MRRVRAWLIVSAGALGACLGAGLFGACTGSPATPSARPADAPAPAPTTPRPDAGTGPTGSGAAAAVAEAGAVPGAEAGSDEASAAAVRTAQQCSSFAAVITNQPDGGVVFNNAMTSADAGFIDRTQGIIDALVARSDRLRCCLNAWAEHLPKDEGRLMLVIELAPDGAVQSAAIDPDRSTIRDALTNACVLDVARATPYPKSPTGSSTIVEYPIVAALAAH